MALRTIFVVFLLCLLFSTIGMADEVYDLSAKLYDQAARPGPRMDFSWAYRYHPHGENSNLYVNGGVDEEGNPMDVDGTVWKALNGLNWNPVHGHRLHRTEMVIPAVFLSRSHPWSTGRII